MSKKLFVGSLSWNTDDHALRDAFAPHGEVTEAKVIADRDSGRSRGFGFVTFTDDEAADKAVAALNQTEPPLSREGGARLSARQECTACVQVPANAHLDNSVNGWLCYRGQRRLYGGRSTGGEP